MLLDQRSFTSVEAVCINLLPKTSEPGNTATVQLRRPLSFGLISRLMGIIQLLTSSEYFGPMAMCLSISITNIISIIHATPLPSIL